MRAEFFRPPVGERRVIGLGLVALDVLESAGVVRSEYRAGGTCANVLAILSYFGWDAYPIARLNGDRAARHVRRDLETFSVNLDFASLDPRSKTPIVRHLIEPTGAHRFSLRCPSCAAWLPTYQPVTNHAVRSE